MDPLNPHPLPDNKFSAQKSRKLGIASSMKKKIKGISGTLLLVVTAPLLALLLTAHVFQPYEVDGLSMETTLQDADRLIVFKLPKTLSNIFSDNYIPDRYDVIVFDRPKQLSAPESTQHLIKRVIGLPGERVVIKDGLVKIYNQDNPSGFDPDNGRDYADDIITTRGNVDITVGSKEVFVLGDNRGNSSDSRVFGTIQSKIIVGQATSRFIPINSMRKL